VGGFTSGSREEVPGKIENLRQENKNMMMMMMMMMIIIIINHTRTTLNKFPTKNCYTRNITHHKESATSLDLKPEWWGSLLAQEEKYQGRKKTCDKGTAI
jgi:hypothetical protein